MLKLPSLPVTRVVGTVGHVDPGQHPAVGVALDSHQPRPGQAPLVILSPLFGQGQVERSALAVEAMGVVQHRVGVQDVDGAGRIT